MNFMNVSFAETSGTFPRERENIGQQLTGAIPLTIPETPVGHISAPVLSLFLYKQ